MPMIITWIDLLLPLLVQFVLSQEARQNDKPANSSDYPEMRRGVTNGIGIDPHQHPP